MGKRTDKFEPEVSEAEWLGSEPCDVWAMWRSMPKPPKLGESNHTRKERLIGAELLRTVADQLTDPRLQAALVVGEQFADGAISQRDYWKAHSAADEAWDSALPRSHAARDANLCAEKYLYSLDDFLMYIAGAIESRELLLARRAKRSTRGLSARSYAATERRIRELIREVHGNPFRPVAFADEWRTSTAVAVAQQMYDSRDFSAMPILADALQDAGCEDDAILSHCRDAKQTHVRECWVVDLVLGKK